MQEAANVVLRNRAALAERPMWLFRSGPTGAATPPPLEEYDEFQIAIWPRDHRSFDGAINHSTLSFSEWVTVKASEGDSCGWGDIDTWAESIARALAPAGSTPTSARSNLA